MRDTEKAVFDVIADYLHAAAIDWQLSGATAAYITSLDFNFWVEALPEGAGYQFCTYWPFRSEVSEFDALTFANECNLTWPMVQFSVGMSESRLQGHYASYCPDGIVRRSLIRSAQKFAGIFAAVINGDDASMLADDIEPETAGRCAVNSLTTH